MLVTAVVVDDDSDVFVTAVAGLDVWLVLLTNLRTLTGPAVPNAAVEPVSNLAPPP